jgi:hypothetical protein
MLQIKAYVELQHYDEITAFSASEAERIVQSCIVTGEGGTLAAQIIEALASPRGAAPPIHTISGKRGAGKSHLLAFLRSLVGAKSLRTAKDDARLTSALRQYADQTPIAIDLNFASHEHTSFEMLLRSALSGVLGAANDFNDERWAQAVASELVFEQVLGALPLNTQLVLFIDGLSGRWRVTPEAVGTDLKWLSMIARQGERLPLRAVVAVDEESLDPEFGHAPSAMRHAPSETPAAVLSRGGRIYYLSPDNLHDLVAHHLLRKTPKQMSELGGLYRQLKQRLPHFAWREDEFVAYYPVHPALYRLAPAIRAYSRSFSLPGFAASAASRALNRPGLSLVVLDEVFDRYEYELHKDKSLEAAFALYDQLASEVTTAMPVEDRLWAKMLAKSLFLFSLAKAPVSVRVLADSQLLFEEGQAEAGYERAARILAHFETACPEAIYAEGEGLDRAYLLSSAHRPVTLEDELGLAAREIASDDPRLAEVLLAVGGHAFADWQLEAGAGAPSRLQPARYGILWRGTIRRGEVRFGRAEEAEAGLVAGISLESDAEDDLLGLGSQAPVASQTFDGGDDWRLVIVPFNCDLDLEAPVVNMMALRWRAGLTPHEAALQPLKMLVALEARQVQENEREEIERVSAELRLRVSELFRDLYLEHGSLVDHRGPQALPAAYGQGTFAEFLACALDATLSSFFPDHPCFEETFTEDPISRLVVDLFANSASDDYTHRLAARFAAPLGLVSQSDGLYRLNIFSDTALSQPFVHRLFALIEDHTENSGLASVPLAEIRRVLAGPPCGLQPAAQHLILGALIAGGLIELLNEETGERLAGVNLHLGFEPARYAALRRVPPIDYPIDVLTTWANQLTERQDLPAPATAEARRRVREALGQWLAHWREQNLTARFEQLPIELMTMSTWQMVSASKRRIERAAAIVDAVLKETIALEAGLSRIVDVFAFDLGVLEYARAQMRVLSDFLDWLPIFTSIRNYLYASEVTGEEEIERARQRLLAGLRDSHKLLEAEQRHQLSELFEDFRRHYSDFYRAAHETSVGQMACRNLIESFYASPEWERFKLLMQLKLDSRSFERDAQALVNLVQETYCELPIADILMRQPHCCCSFRLNRRLNLGSLLDALKSVASAAATYYCHLLWLRREALRERLRARGDEQTGRLVDGFLAACGNNRLDGLTLEVVSVLNECLTEPAVVKVMPTLPGFGEGNYTKEELREHITRWLESLPEQDGIRFRVEGA